MVDLSLAVKRHIGFKDMAGIKDGAGNVLPLTRMPNGRLFPPFGEEYISNIGTTKLRADDILVCGYPKTGCHWTWEIMVMILKGKAEYSDIGKLVAMLELANPEVIESTPSPRILNTHVWFDELPSDLRTLKNKIVLTTRNPKDVAVSLYNHHINLTDMFSGYNSQFKDWMHLWLNGTVEYESFVEFHQKWDQAIREFPDHPILIMSYEKMKQDLEGAVRRLATFLEVDLTEEQIQDITRAAEFDVMKAKFKGSPSDVLIRKGEVGDWKNWFTDVMSEEVDKWKPELDKTRFTFTYT